MRVNRLFMASRYAKNAEEQSEFHDHQQYVRVNHGYEERQYCHEHPYMLTRPEPCCFPRVLNDEFMDNPEEHELFVRVSSGHRRALRFEGFVPSHCTQKEEGEEREGPILFINFRDLDLKKWPTLQKCLGDGRDEESLETIKNESSGMRATFIALRKKRRIRTRTSTVRDSLVCACNYFSGTMSDTGAATWIPNLLQYNDERFHVIAEGRSPHRPHEHADGFRTCRYVRLVVEKSGGISFVGFILQDGQDPWYQFDDDRDY